MKNSHKWIFCVLICSFVANPILAGKWVNWGAIVEDIQDGIVAAVDFIVEKVSAKQAKIIASGIATTKKVALGMVDTIDVTGAGTLIVTQDDKQEGLLVIETDQALMPYIEAEVVGKTLIIKTRDNTSYNVEGLVYRVSVKDLKHLSLTGAVSGSLNSIKTESLLLDLTGASRLTGDLVVENLVIKSFGASRITLTGKATMQNLDVSGSSKVDGRNVIGKSAVVHVDGASTVYCNASGILSGHVSGVSSLYYANNPVVSVKSSGVSSVQKL